jgi:large subunit ribosomal protein L13
MAKGDKAGTHKNMAKWHHVDATDQVLGRLAVRIATVLMGKHKPIYTPHVDTGDFVVVTNAEKIRMTGDKMNTMTYDSYSYHPGGFKRVPIKRVMDRHPERVLGEAVRRMLPKNALGRHMLKKLKIYTGPEHPHVAQSPEPLANTLALAN